MIAHMTRVHVTGITGRDFTDFMLNPTDESYRRWWPGMHLAFHVVKSVPGHVGDVVVMDEHVGRHHLKMKAVVEEAVPGRRIAWRAVMGVRLPIRIVIELEDSPKSLTIVHSVEVGWRGAGRLFDPLLRLFFHDGRFTEDMDAHAQEEFPRLARMLGTGN
jgi:hypothetical protein